MTNRYAVLSEKEILDILKHLPDWVVFNGKLEATFEFPTYRKTIEFITRVGKIAEKLNHHPEFWNAYTKVHFSFCTHDVGNKITNMDVKLAQEINTIAKRHT